MPNKLSEFKLFKTTHLLVFINCFASIKNLKTSIIFIIYKTLYRMFNYNIYEN